MKRPPQPGRKGMPHMDQVEERSRPYRVLHLVSQLDVGGMEKLLVEFARHADRRLVSVCFICLGDRGKLVSDIEACGWPVIALRERFGVRPALVLRLARLMRHLRADVIHTHNTRPLLYGAPAARLARVGAVVHTRHGQRFGATTRATKLFAWACRLVDRVVSVSEDGTGLCRAEGVAEHRTCTIRNGIDVSRFEYAPPVVRGPAVMVGRLSPEKGVEVLVRAVAIAAEKEPAFRVLIAGGGACLSDLVRLAQDLCVERHVEFLGEVRNVADVLGRGSLFVLPSLTEGISLTLLEAMAAGLPVVATRVGGTPEVVTAEVGVLVSPGSPRELADAMLRIWSDATVGRRMGAAGRRRVEAEFDVTRMVSEYEALYRSIVSPLVRVGH